MTPYDERFDARVDSSSGASACWPFTGAKTGAGYGSFFVAGHKIGAHVFALARKLGRPLAAGMVALHSCDNPICCNPDHLSEATQGENAADCANKKRHVFGQRNGQAKLTNEQAIELRSAADAAGHRRGVYTELALRYGISPKAAGDIANGRRWALVTAEVAS